jgi:hypothetical protein
MTPKEKAEELVEKMFSLSTTNAFPAKQCALIAVDEIINSIVVTNLSVAENQFLFWEQVKQEINNL